MASTGKLDVEVELKSGADKFWKSILDSSTVFPKVCPDLYKSIEVSEGDGKSVGSVRIVNFGEGSPLVKTSHEKIEEFDEGKRKIAYSVTGGDILKYYKDFKASLEVIPKGDGGLVKWVCEFEKASDEVPDPNIIRDFAAKNFQEIDAYLVAAP